jgi:hypothetical protein
VYNYILGRPWRYLFYTAVMLVYGAITYLFFGLVLFAALAITHWAVGLWVGGSVAGGLSRFESIVPRPEFGELIQPLPTVEQRSGSAGVAAWIVMVWVRLLVALLPAFATSYYFSAHTWIYLLLRRAADGTAFDDVYRHDVSNQSDAAPAADDRTADE